MDPLPGGSDGKESACSAGGWSLIPESGRFPREGNDNPLQYSCLENFMDRRTWWARVHGVAESDTTEQLTHRHTQCKPALFRGQLYITKVYHFKHVKVYSSVALSTFTLLCNHHHYLLLENTLNFPFPTSLAATILRPASMNLTAL